MCGSPRLFIKSIIPAGDIEESLGDNQIELCGYDDDWHH